MKNLLRRSLPILLTVMILTSLFGTAFQTAFAVGSDETMPDSDTEVLPETNENADEVTNYDGEQDDLSKINASDFMTEEQYSALGFSLDRETDFKAITDEDGNVIDSDESSDAVDPLDGYETNTINELFMGEGNRSKDWEQKGYLLQTAKDYPTSYTNVKDSDSYFFGAFSQQSNIDYSDNAGRNYQFQITEAIKIGNLNTDDYIPDSVIQAGLFTSDENDGENYTQADITIYSFNQDTYKFEKKQTLGAFNLNGSSDFGADIEIDEIGGYLSLAVGDYDGDGYNEFAMYCPYEKTSDREPRILLFDQKSDGTFYICENDILSLGNFKDENGVQYSHFYNTENDRRRPLCSLSTTDISGHDDLVINISMPWISEDDDKNMIGNSLTAICSWNGKESCDKAPDFVYSQSYSYDGTPLDITGETISEVFATDKNDFETVSKYRMKYASATTMDLSGNGDDALVIAGNMEFNYDAGTKNGKMCIEYNLLQLVCWNGKTYENAWEKAKAIPVAIYQGFDFVKESKLGLFKSPLTVTAAALTNDTPKQTLFAEGVLLDFTMGSGSSSIEQIKNGTFVEIYKMNCEGGTNLLFFHTAISGSFVENDALKEQIIVICGDGSGDSIYLDLYMLWNNGSGIQCSYRNDYFDHRDEDDDGTFMTLCAVDVDNDSIRYKYESCEIAYSDPEIYAVMLSSPYWSELDYGTSASARGQTTFTVSTSNGTSEATKNGYNATGQISQQFGGPIGPRGGFSISYAGNRMWGHQTSVSESVDITFTSNGGCDRLALLVTPTAIYKYKVFVPEHITEEEDIECYEAVHGEECPYKAGDIYPAEYSYMYCTIPLTPVYTIRAVSEYNKVVDEYNRLLSDEWDEYCEKQKSNGNTAKDYDKYYEENSLDVIDLDKIYANRVVGDPTTYSSDSAMISSIQGNSKTNLRESPDTISVDFTKGATETSKIGSSESSTSTKDRTHSLKVDLSFGWGYAIGNTVGTVGAGYQRAVTHSTVNTDAVNYAMTFQDLPKSAVNDISESGVPTTSYNFNTTLITWQLYGAEENSDEYKGIPMGLDGLTVIGCTVSNANAKELPSLPDEFYVSAVTDTTAVLNWTENANKNRTPNFYELYVQGGSTTEYTAVKDWETGENLKIPASEDSYKLENLKENTTYTFRLKAYYEENGKSSVLGPPAQAKTLAADSDKYPVITSQPKDIFRNIDDKADFTLTAEKSASADSKNILEYKWQKLTIKDYYSTEWVDITNQSSDWTDITENGTYNSVFNAAYYAKDGLINSANAKYLDRTVYRCVVTESVYGSTGETYTSYSDAAVLYIGNCPHKTYENGFCTSCGQYEPATLNSNGIYEISNAGQLFWFASLVNGDKTHADFDAQNTGAKAVLVKDINLESREWSPIMNFSGTFDGDNHTISNLNITNTSTYSGLFGKTSGTIKNFTLKGDITLSSDGDKIGGVVGSANGATVSGVTSYVNISNTDGELHHIGGVVGCIENNETIVDKCVYYGIINVKDSHDCIGGIVGYTNAGARISNCANHGTVSASKEGAYVGGILGYVNNTNPTVKDCYNYGTVSNGDTTTYCGAIIGWARNYASANIDNNYYLDTSSSLAFGSGGKSGVTATSKTADEFKSGEVTYLLNHKISDENAVWYQNIDNGKTPDDYPVFDGGIVYYLEYKDSYSNFYSEAPDEFDRDDDGNFIIRTYDDLVKLSNLVRSDYKKYGSADYVLVNNIIAPEDAKWTQGIGSVSDNKPFNGTFYGKGYFVASLNVNSPEYGGLFEAIGESGYVKDLYVIDCKFSSSSETAGGIAAVNYGTIDHCISGISISSGNLKIEDKTIHWVELNSTVQGGISGGIAGENSGSIIGCRSSAMVFGTQCGGIAGVNTGTIYGCANNSITVGDSTSEVSGGLAGTNGGTIESSYNSGYVYGTVKGAVAGKNQWDGLNPTIKNVFYFTDNGLNPVGTGSTSGIENAVEVDSSDVLSGDNNFVNMLNDVTDTSIVEWIRSDTLNKGYPTIKSECLNDSVQSAGNNITVKGAMHADLNIRYDVCSENDEEFALLASLIGKDKILKAYSVSLTDNDGNNIPAELWCREIYKISVPVENENVRFAGISTDGNIVYYEPVSVENGTAVFNVSHPMSFAIVDTSTEIVPTETGSTPTETQNVPSDKNTDADKTTNDNTAIQTGTPMSSSITLLVAMLSLAVILIVKRRKRIG